MDAHSPDEEEGVGAGQLPRADASTGIYARAEQKAQMVSVSRSRDAGGDGQAGQPDQASRPDQESRGGLAKPC